LPVCRGHDGGRGDLAVTRVGGRGGEGAAGDGQGEGDECCETHLDGRVGGSGGVGQD